jgi:hypothetical protein
VVVAKGVILLPYFDVGNVVSGALNGIKKICCSFFKGFAVSAGLIKAKG